MKYITLVVLLLSSAPASAFNLCLSDDPTCSFGTPPRQYSGDGDLSRAMNTCEQHSHDTGTSYPEGGAPPRVYNPGWEACNLIRQKWNEGEQAKAIREQTEQTARDKAFVDDFANQLKK